MSTPDCEHLAQEYAKWLTHDITAEMVGSVCVVSVPFLDRHRDFLQVCIVETDEGLVITDDGYTIRDLHISGLDLDTPRRQEALDEILNSFGVLNRENELTVIASGNDLPRRKHDLVQAMLAVGNLIHLAQPTVVSVFKEDIHRYLSLKEVPFSIDIRLQGESGLNHGFDFVIGSVGNHPEQYLRAINVPNRENIVELIFSWQDVKDSRPPGTQVYAILNDEVRQTSRSLLDALDTYKIDSIPWSERERQFGVFSYTERSNVS